MNSSFFDKASFRNANLERANFRGGVFVNANFSNANLRNANFYVANLEGANLEGANLERANLERANLERAILIGTKMSDVHSYGTNFFGVIDSFDIRKIKNEYTAEIERLEQERLELLKSNEENKEILQETLKKNQAKIDILEKELQEKSRSSKAIERIDYIFNNLDEEITKNIDKEAIRLKCMFTAYYVAIAVFLVLLIIVWVRFYIGLSILEENDKSQMDFSTFWINISPSVLIVSLIVLCVFQVHKCQRQLLSLQEFLYSHQLIRGNMSSIISINGEENVSKSIEKVSSMFENWANFLIKSNVNIGDYEDVMLDLDKKDASVNEKTMELIKELIKKI